jgi:hypothetical protein
MDVREPQALVAAILMARAEQVNATRVCMAHVLVGEPVFTIAR